MIKVELSVVLEKHKLWLNHKKGGVRANLSGANLREADLSEANLRWANLRWANLREADLSGANLDYSCLPLWCGSLTAKFDDRQIIQIVYHAVNAGLRSTNTSNEVKQELVKVIGLANRFHRVGECGEIKFDAKEEQ